MHVKKLCYDDDDDIVTAIITALYIQTYQPAILSRRNVINSQNLLLNVPLKLPAPGSVLLVFSLLFFFRISFYCHT